MNLITEDLKAQTVAEAILLKKQTTVLERLCLRSKRLNFEPADPEFCVYGLLTGNCSSQRAIDLKNAVAKPYSRDTIYWVTAPETAFSTCEGFSPLEFYILQPDAQNETLLAYLTGERDALTIADL